MAEEQAKEMEKEESLFSGSDDSSSSDDDNEEVAVEQTITNGGSSELKPKADTTTEKKEDDMDDLFGSGSDDDDDDDSSSDDSDEDNDIKSTVKTRTGEVDDSSSRNDSKNNNLGQNKKNIHRPTENLFLPPRFEISGDINMIRTSRLVGIQTKGYDSENFDKTADATWNTDEHGNKRYLNIIRWRYKKNKDGTIAMDEKGNKVTESNARIISWSDGTKSIQIGNELLDIDVKPLPQHQHWVYKQVMNKPPDAEADTVLECAGDYVKSRWSVKPSSVNSKSHKELVRLQQKSRAKKKSKQDLIKRTVTITDPEKDDEDRWKAEEKEIQALERQRRRSKVDRFDEYANSGPLSANYLEEDNDSPSDDDDDEEEEWDAGRTLSNNNNNKQSRAERAAQRNAAKEDVMEEEDDEEQDDDKEKKAPATTTTTTTTTTATTTTKSAKRPLEDDDDDDDDDDDEEIVKQPVRKKQKVAAKIIDDDDDDDDDE